MESKALPHVFLSTFNDHSKLKEFEVDLKTKDSVCIGCIDKLGTSLVFSDITS